LASLDASRIGWKRPEGSATTRKISSLGAMSLRGSWRRIWRRAPWVTEMFWVAVWPEVRVT
jgi:hypothetical protein